MKPYVFAAAAILALSVQAQDQPKELKDGREKLSYSLGINIGNTWKQRGIEADPELVARGIRDAMGGTPQLTEQEVREVIMAFQTELRQKQEAKRKELGEKNKVEGPAFLAENKTKPGVVTTPSGLQYKIINEGEGTPPKATDRVKVHYKGTLVDGTEFDSSYKRGQPAAFTVNGVIKGWQEALQMMKPGAKWELFIPSELAYGERGAGNNIGPNATLIFQVELLSVEPQAAQTKVPSLTQPVTSDIIKVPSEEELKKGAKIEILKPEDVEKLKQQEAKQQESKGQEPKKD